MREDVAPELAWAGASVGRIRNEAKNYRILSSASAATISQVPADETYQYDDPGQRVQAQAFEYGAIKKAVRPLRETVRPLKEERRWVAERDAMKPLQMLSFLERRDENRRKSVVRPLREAVRPLGEEVPTFEGSTTDLWGKKCRPLREVRPTFEGSDSGENPANRGIWSEEFAFPVFVFLYCIVLSYNRGFSFDKDLAGEIARGENRRMLL